MFPKYLDALKSLVGAEGTAANGIALADLTPLWTEMLKGKPDSDLTSNEAGRNTVTITRP